MPYCPKCGNNVDEVMAFCQKCGTALKISAPNQAQLGNERQEKQESQEKPPHLESRDKNQYGCINYLIIGLILVILGVFAIMFLTSSLLVTGQNISIGVVIIGVVIIMGTVYVFTPVEKYFKRLTSSRKKAPTNP